MVKSHWPFYAVGACSCRGTPGVYLTWEDARRQLLGPKDPTTGKQRLEGSWKGHTSAEGALLPWAGAWVPVWAMVSCAHVPSCFMVMVSCWWLVPLLAAQMLRTL
jgi:hypothetical protein